MLINFQIVKKNLQLMDSCPVEVLANIFRFLKGQDSRKFIRLGKRYALAFQRYEKSLQKISIDLELAEQTKWVSTQKTLKFRGPGNDTSCVYHIDLSWTFTM